jgi:DNA-binding LacI/PurR family transcriptional regulator
MPTIGDVARAAGVGIGTVSRVLNSSPLVSDATRQRVLAAMERLGYRPSRVARAFGKRRTHVLEVLVPVFARAVALETLGGIEDALGGTDYSLLVRTVEDEAHRDRVYDDCCDRDRADGAFVVWMPATTRFVERLSAETISAVFLNVADPRLWNVSVDHAMAARSAVEYCLALGHRRISLVDRLEDPFDTTSPGICQQGYREALAAASLSVPPEYNRVAEFSPQGGSAALASLLALPEAPTAVVVGSDTQAVGVIEAARGQGRRVPEDLSVVGYNDSEFAQFLGLTTVQVPVREIARVAADVLLAAVAEPALEPNTIYLPTQLVVRETCAPPASTYE